MEERPLEHEPELDIAQFFQERKEPLDVALPRVRTLMNELREIAFAHGAQLEDPLTHEVEALPRAGDRGQLRRALAGQIAHRPVLRETGMHGFMSAASGDDLHAIRIEPERGGNPACRRGHRIPNPLVGDHCSGAHRHGEAKSILVRWNRQWLHAGLLGGQSHRGNLLRRAIGPRRVHLDEPLA